MPSGNTGKTEGGTHGVICPPNHKHALTLTCYRMHECRCPECVSGHRERRRQRAKAQAYGRWDNGFVDPAKSLNRIRELMEFGMGVHTIEHRSGVSRETVEKILAGQPKVRRSTEERILALIPDHSTATPGARIPSTGARRRIEALIAVGWSLAAQAEEMGLYGPQMVRLLRSTQITSDLNRRIGEHYSRLWNQNPPMTNQYERRAYKGALKWAKEKGFVAPLAWDDIDNDPEPPLSEVAPICDEVKVDLAMEGKSVTLNRLERELLVRKAHDLRWSDNRTADVSGIDSRTVLRIRRDLGIDAWPQELLEKRTA
ncbi:hypothetical protein [Gryllotalpicola koreensis]|uniref:Helix-turn-helix DNA binding domain protein n=1 Tax=Gryllotalpicola koreensis TaxID=993086 RepID=A0ABP8A284_9MICO